MFNPLQLDRLYPPIPPRHQLKASLSLWLVLYIFPLQQQLYSSYKPRFVQLFRMLLVKSKVLQTVHQPAYWYFGEGNRFASAVHLLLLLWKKNGCNLSERNIGIDLGAPHCLDTLLSSAKIGKRCNFLPYVFNCLSNLCNALLLPMNLTRRCIQLDFWEGLIPIIDLQRHFSLVNSINKLILISLERFCWP